MKKLTSMSILYFFIIIWTIIQLYPIIFMFINGIKTESQFVNNPWFVSFPVNLSKWVEVWKGGSIGVPIGRYFVNSLIVSIGSIIAITLTGMHCGYSLSHFRFPGKRIIYGIFLGAMAIPTHALLIPIFIMMGNLGLRNTYIGLIGVYTAFWLPFTVIVMTANFKSVPKEIIESAYIDGCSEIRVLWSIVMPLSKGIISGMAIINFIGTWSELLYTYLLMNKPQTRTLTVGLMSFKGEHITEWTQIFAGLSMASLPVIIVFLIFHRNITKGMTLGAFR